MLYIASDFPLWNILFRDGIFPVQYGGYTGILYIPAIALTEHQAVKFFSLLISFLSSKTQNCFPYIAHTRGFVEMVEINFSAIWTISRDAHDIAEDFYWQPT